MTVMFTDLVESTAMRVRLGEEEAERLRERHDRLVRAVVVAAQGRVAKHTGDGVMAIFPGASDAISAAVCLQQEMAADARTPSTPAGPLQIRIGISAGDVTIEGDDCFGLPVVEAQRLEGAARPGQILISALVSALARGRGGHELVPVGALDLKGLDAPVEAQEVRWSPRPAEAASLPAGLADRGAFPFAGRTKEAELILGAWASATAGATPLVLISGEPGIGKTRLAAQVATAVLDKGGTVLAGRCDELVGAPYQPFGEALRQQAGRPGGTDRLGPAAAELTRLFPELVAVVPGLPEPLAAGPEAERLRLFDAVRGWLADLTSESAALLVLDDLHWADAGTLLLLRHVIATDRVPGLLVVGTYRDTDVDRTTPLSGMLGELRRRSDVTRVVLEGLDPTEVSDLMSRAAGHELEEDGQSLALAVQAETGGNPFFIGEVLRHLAESGAIVYSAGRWAAARAGDEQLLPEGIKDVVGRRLSALPDVTQSSLATAAVIGVDFDLDVLSAVSGMAEEELIDCLEAALSAHLLVETGVGRYRFSHALVRSTLHGELSTTRRARLHRVVAETLEALYAADLDAIAPELAYHWAEAGPATAHEHAITYARRVAELAWSRPAPEEAARWYGKARELLDGADPALDAEMAARQGHAEMLAGIPGWQQRLREAARAAEQLGDPRLMAASLCLSNRSLLIEESPDPADLEKVALLERALELARDDPALTAELNGALALELMFTGDRQRRAALARATDEYCATVEDPIERHRLFRLAGRARSLGTYTRSDLEGYWTEWEQVAEAARRAGVHDIEANALSGLFYVSMWLGRPDRGDVIDRLTAALRDYPHPLLSDDLILCHMNAALIDGRLEEAEQLAERVERMSRAHGREAEAQIFGSSGRLQVTRERIGLAPLTDVLRALPGPAPETTRPTAGRGLIVLAMAESGAADGATSLLYKYGSKHFADLPEDSGLPVARSAFCEAAALLRYQPACRDLFEKMLAVADVHQATGGWYLGSTARYLGLLCDALDRSDEADGWFSRAEAEHEVMRTPAWLARGLLDWAESLVRRGRQESATELAERALAVIGDLDLSASRTRAERILRGNKRGST